MPFEVRLPQLGESVFEGTIGKWLKHEGDTIGKNEPLLEVVTDKVDTEITSDSAGTVLRILVPEGETVKVGTVLAYVGMPGEELPLQPGGGQAAPESPAPPIPADQSAASAAQTPPAADDTSGAPARVSPLAARIAAERGLDVSELRGSGPGGQVTREDVERHAAEGGTARQAPDVVPGGAAVAEAGPAQGPVAVPAAARDLGFVSPRVARLAAEHGVDLRKVPGTGLNGRITAADVERHVAGRQEEPARGPGEAAGPPSGAPGTALPGAVAADPGVSRAPAEEPAVRRGEVVPLTQMRRLIAEHMVRSAYSAPHVATVHEADMSAVVAAYEQLKAPFAERGVKLTYTAFLVQVVAEALAEFPVLNSSFTDDGILVHEDINIGLAVALPQGLIVPVIRNADQKSLVGIAADVVDLATRARSKQLVPGDVQGGTFTITNYGTLGSLIGTPIISQPQVAILGTGAIRKRVVAVETEMGDQIAIRPMMYLSLSFDHRVLDGGSADPFVASIVARLQSYTP